MNGRWMEKELKVLDRIPYERWINSQLSVARFAGGCMINEVKYELDFEGCKKEIIDGEERFFPDLVEVKQ